MTAMPLASALCSVRRSDPARTMMEALGIVAPDGSSTRTVNRCSWADATAAPNKRKTETNPTTNERIRRSYDGNPGGFTSTGTIYPMATLAEVLNARTREGDVYERLDRGWARCHACGHDCRIPPGAVGVCKVRFNRDGTLHVPWGYVAGVQCDPIEKKPFFHAWPGALAYSFGMLGCDLHCSYCQNWVTSQALRDPAAVAPPRDVEPDALARDAVRPGARPVGST